MTPEDLAEKTNSCALSARVAHGTGAAGYSDYNAKSKKFKLNPEQACAFADGRWPAFFAGVRGGAIDGLDEPKVAAAFKSGKGVGWHEHSTCLFRGTERFFRPGYNAHLVSEWIPHCVAKGKARERREGRDVGCGHGASTILMALAYPKSKFYG